MPNWRQSLRSRGSPVDQDPALVASDPRLSIPAGSGWTERTWWGSRILANGAN